MQTENYTLQIKPAQTEGKTLAYVKVLVGPMWATFRLEKSGERFFLNPHASFAEKLKGRDTKVGKHSGWIETAGLSADAAREIKSKVMAELNLKEGVA